MRTWPERIGRTARRLWFIVPLALLWRRRRSRKPPWQPPKELPTAYFAGGKVTLLVRHSADLRDNPERVLAIIKRDPATEGEFQNAFNKQFWIHSFPAVRDKQPFSLVTLDLGAYLPDRELVAVINRIDERLNGREDQQGVEQVSMIMPTWLANSTAHAWSVGGPGARPVPVEKRAVEVRDGREPWGFEQSENSSRAAGVTVAVLDTAPRHWNLAFAYDHWQAENPLLASLLGPNGPLHITYMPYTQAAAIHDWPLRDHQYDMSDHGLFAAGIIHSIAREARIELIEVLSPTGVGTIESLIWGLQQAIPLAERGPLIINCSLMLALPSDAAQLKRLCAETIVGSLNPRQFADPMKPLREVCDTLTALGACIVAAAGNDGDPQTAPFARYPAALPNVNGVAAINRDQDRASYSNRSERQGEIGVAAFGGAATPSGQTDPDKGMLGLYIGDFPPGTFQAKDPANGWARWAGTSFAAPVISGMLATLLNRSIQDPQERCAAAWRELESTITRQESYGKIFPIVQN